MSSDDRWAEVEPILDHLLDAPDAERARLAREAAAGDAALERRLLALVAAAATGSPLDRPVVELAPTLAEAATTIDPGDAGGRRLGPWRIVRLLGEGGMGRVYLAERADGQFDRQVALKVLATARLSDAARLRFQRERQILAGLRHEHVARLHDAGVDDDGRPWFALELVDGPTITVWAREARLGREERVALLLQACDAVAYAHGRGIVHRDLKPSNLLVGRDAEGAAHLSVLDFGIARAAGAVELTATGDVLGTPGYMAPEQARGEVETVDRRADVFALGVILYELLCERRPFDGETPGEVLGAVLASDPPSPRSLVADLPRDLETIVATCLDKAPEGRYPSARALADDLRAWLQGEPIAARAPGLLHRLRRRARRHPLAAAALVALALSAAVGATIAARGRVLAKRQADLSRRLGATAEQVAAEIRHEHLAPLHDVTAARTRLATRIDALERDLDATPEPLRPALRLAIGRGRLALGDGDAALADLRAAWSGGLRTADARAALADAESARLARERAAAEALPDPNLRAERLAALADSSSALVAELGDGTPQESSPSSETEATSAGDLFAARSAFLGGDLDGAERRARATIVRTPWRYEAATLLGDVELERLSRARRDGARDALLPRLDAALAAFEEAAAVGRSDPAAQLRLCAAAAAGLDLALQTISTDADALGERGAAACRRAALADPANGAVPEQEATLRTTWARERSRRDRDPFPEIAAAIAAGERAVALAPASASAARRLGDAWAFRAEFERERGVDSAPSLANATASLERAATLAPDDAGVWNSLGLAHWERLLAEQEHDRPYGQPARDAAAAFERAVALEPRYAYAWGNLGSMRNKIGEAALADGGDSLTAWSAAREAFERSLAIFPGYATAVNNLGNVLHNLGELRYGRGEDSRDEFARAVAQFDRAVELRPDWFVPRINQARSGLALAQAAARAGDAPEPALERAEAALAAGLGLRSEHVQAQILAGEIHLFRAEVDRRSGAAVLAALAAVERTLAKLRTLDGGAARELESGLAAFRRGESTPVWPPPLTVAPDAESGDRAATPSAAPAATAG